MLASTLTFSCALQKRISVRCGWLTRFTRRLAIFPPLDINGRLATSHSPVSSVIRSPSWSYMGRTRAVTGSGFVSGGGLSIHGHPPSLAHSPVGGRFVLPPPAPRLSGCRRWRRGPR